MVGDEPEKTGRVLWDCKAFWVWEATAPPGRCCTSCGARWCGLAAKRLSGRVEVDETYVGGEEEGLHGRQTQKKALVAIAAEEDGAGLGRIRMRRIRRASKHQLHGFIQEAVEPDSTIHTDGWEGLRRSGGAWLSARIRLSGNFQPISL